MASEYKMNEPMKKPDILDGIFHHKRDQVFCKIVKLLRIKVLNRALRSTVT